MPRYFFHRTDGRVDQDTTGTQLSGIGAARIEAVVFAGETLRDRPGDLWPTKDFRVEVTDESGGLLFAIVVQAIDSPTVDDRLNLRRRSV